MISTKSVVFACCFQSSLQDFQASNATRY